MHAPPPSLSIDGLVQHTPPHPLLFTSFEIPLDINNLGEPLLQRRFLVVLVKPKVRDIRYPAPFSLCSAVNETETI